MFLCRESNSIVMYMLHKCSILAQKKDTEGRISHTLKVVKTTWVLSSNLPTRHSILENKTGEILWNAEYLSRKSTIHTRKLDLMSAGSSDHRVKIIKNPTRSKNKRIYETWDFEPIIMGTVLLETRFMEYLSCLKITVVGRNTNDGEEI